MNIKIAHYIAQTTTLERFQLHISGDMNLGNVHISDNMKHHFAFTDTKAKMGDKIILYIGKGKDYVIAPQEDDEVQEIIHVFHWGVISTSWNMENTIISITDGNYLDTYTLQELLYVPPFIKQ